MYMKTVHGHSYMLISLIIVSAFIMATGCKKMADTESLNNQTVSDAQVGGSFRLGGFTEVNVLANKNYYHALQVDGRLHNAWGISASPGGTFWISAADAGLSFVSSSIGIQPIPPVSIPSHIDGERGNPTGTIINGTTHYVIKATDKQASFLFASEDGTVSGWNGSTGASAVIVKDLSEGGAGYTGLAIANDGGSNFLYVTDFAQHRVQVFDKNYKFISGKWFVDPGIPKKYSPFNIRTINNMLYVTYAVVASDGDDSTGAGLGYVDVYWPNGSLSKRFATQGTLNAPWGITPASADLVGMSAILIGNFGDGRINVYDLDGNFQGQLKSSEGGGPVSIDGLWAIDNTIANTSLRQLYFTAGPNGEEDGLFGFLSKL